MFSKDVRHYAPTPRRLSESKFGPDARLDTTPRLSAFDKFMAVMGVISIGAAIGLLMGWNG